MNFSFKTAPQFLIAVFVLIFTLTFIPVETQAAPYGPENKATVFDRLYESDLVVYGKIRQKIKSKEKGDLTEFEVYANIQGGNWKKGDFFYLNDLVKEKEKTVGVLYLYQSSFGGSTVYELNTFYPDKKKEMYEYTLKIKEYMDEGDNEGRLRWLYSQVDSEDRLIAWDSFAQLGMAPYAQLKGAASSIDRESLRYLISLPDSKVKPNRKSFFGFLLGLAGNPEDKALLKRIIDNPANKNSEIVHGSMMGLGLLSENPSSYYYEKMNSGPANMQKAVIDAVENIMIYERPKDPQPILKPIYWALKNGNREIVKDAVAACGQMKITGPVQYMRNIYFNTFSNYKEGKIAVINYLKFVRKKTPDAVKLLDDIKAKETDSEIRSRV